MPLVWDRSVEAMQQYFLTKLWSRTKIHKGDIKQNLYEIRIFLHVISGKHCPISHFTITTYGYNVKHIQHTGVTNS